MHSQNRRSEIDSNKDTRRVSLELISFERPFSSQIEKENILQYIEETAKDMRDISVKADIPFVAYLLNIVAQEACEARNGLDAGKSG